MCSCCKIAENGILGMLTLKSSLSLFAVLDIVLGVLYALFFYREIVLEWNFFRINGPHYIMLAFYASRILSLPIGIVGFLAVKNQSAKVASLYHGLTLFELLIFPALGMASTIDMCESWLYREACNQILVQNLFFNVLRVCYLFYVAYIAKSYQRRIERGELILVQHGKAIVELINQVQNKQKNDIELTNVQKKGEETKEEE